MNTSGIWLNAEIQAQIEPPPISLIRAKLQEQKATNIIKDEIFRNTSQATSETNKVNRYTFNNGQPEELLALLKNWKIATDVTGTTLSSGQIKYLRTLLRG